MADKAHDWTDQQIALLSMRMHAAYQKAAEEMADKLKDLLAEYDEGRAEKEQELASGKIDQTQYDDWLKWQANRQQWIRQMSQELALDATRADALAMDYINGEVQHVFCENVNQSFYGIERQIGYDTHSFTMYDQKTVALMLADPEATRLPKAKHDAKKDLAWNMEHINAAITQAILQGESIPNASKRLQAITDMDRKAALRTARTIMTSAENAGRVESYRVADKAGVRVEKRWMATLDTRTRQSHREMDGVHVPYDVPFVVGPSSAKMMHPADPQGPPEECYGCRCTLTAWTPRIDAEKAERWSNLPPDMTYEKWMGAKQNAQDKQTKPETGQQQAHAQQKKYTHAGSTIWKQLGKADPDKVRGKVEKMLAKAHGKAAQLWSKFEGKLTYADPVHKGKKGVKGAFFAPHGSKNQYGVHLNLQSTLYNKTEGELATWFHEFGHNIDYAGAKGSWYVTGTNNWEFGKTIRAEVGEIVAQRQAEMEASLSAMRDGMDLEGIVNLGITPSWAKKYGGYHKTAVAHADDDEWLKAHQMWHVTKIKDMDARRRAIFDHYAKLAWVPTGKIPIQTVREVIGREITKSGLNTQLAVGDIFEGATMGGCQDTYGHGKSYWTANGSKVAKEAFAEFFSAECIYGQRPELLETMMKWLPKSYAAYQQIVEGMLK